jgi:hypothetical protein
MNSLTVGEAFLSHRHNTLDMEAASPTDQQSFWENALFIIGDQAPRDT